MVANHLSTTLIVTSKFAISHEYYMENGFDEIGDWCYENLEPDSHSLTFDGKNEYWVYSITDTIEDMPNATAFKLRWS